MHNLTALQPPAGGAPGGAECCSGGPVLPGVREGIGIRRRINLENLECPGTVPCMHTLPLNLVTLQEPEWPFHNIQDSRGQTPLFVAAALGHTDCVRLLLTNGADRMVSDIRGNLPLHMAAWWGHLSITFMLLDYCLPESAAGAAPK